MPQGVGLGVVAGGVITVTVVGPVGDGDGDGDGVAVGTGVGAGVGGATAAFAGGGCSAGPTGSSAAVTYVGRPGLPPLTGSAGASTSM